ncbi:hypothetical protein K435DRAFT_172186 [Dendrothele bispora CBS 962.96]|uniref:Uncharacterized protein n=1 Tax=Dendrothele bispora (strain CBS 962.96) TaxID=1314807 RepID=A0A4V4HIT3_DENBC|nr:hypothetical protein K435DRAFT_172186 [Dendrothele bispora CBS 962.96]
MNSWGFVAGALLCTQVNNLDSAENFCIDSNETHWETCSDSEACFHEQFDFEILRIYWRPIVSNVRAPIIQFLLHYIGTISNEVTSNMLYKDGIDNDKKRQLHSTSMIVATSKAFSGVDQSRSSLRSVCNRVSHHQKEMSKYVCNVNFFSTFKRAKHAK